MVNNFKSLVERKLIPRGKSGNDIIYVCPKCDDKSGHLWVNYNTNKFHCFRCDWGGKSLVPLVRELGIDISFDYDSLDRSYNEGLDEILSMGDTRTKSKRSVDYSRSLRTLTTYYEYHTTSLSTPALQYLLNRGLSQELINRLKIREGINRYGQTMDINGKKIQCRDYSGRIMVPSITKVGTISFFVARDYTGTKKNKYINPPKELAFSSEDVYNLDQVDSEHVIICEGVFSAIAVMSALGKNMAVATYGKSIASKSNSDNPTITVTSQGEKLLNKKFKTYYVFYDLDAHDSAIATCNYLYERGANVKLITITTNKYGQKADANDLTKDEILECIVNAKQYTRFTSLEDLF